MKQNKPESDSEHESVEERSVEDKSARKKVRRLFIDFIGILLSLEIDN